MSGLSVSSTPPRSAPLFAYLRGLSVGSRSLFLLLLTGRLSILLSICSSRSLEDQGLRRPKKLCDLLLGQLGGLLTIDAKEQVIALNAILGWLPRVNVQHMGRLARCHEPKCTAFNDYDLCINFVNFHRLGKGYLHLSASKR